jgi:hypothetical protein
MALTVATMICSFFGHRSVVLDNIGRHDPLLLCERCGSVRSVSWIPQNNYLRVEPIEYKGHSPRIPRSPPEVPEPL